MGRRNSTNEIVLSKIRYHNTIEDRLMSAVSEPPDKSDDHGFSDRTGIYFHEGKKYLRKIYSAVEKGQYIEIDVYSVIKAFDVKDGPLSHALKKILCAGKRDKGDKKADLVGVLAAVNRAIDQLEEDEDG
jgi:hypothetical protein